MPQPPVVAKARVIKQPPQIAASRSKAQDLSRAINAEVIKLQTARDAGRRHRMPELKPMPSPASITIDYKPQIHITATGSNVAEFKAAADQSLMEGEERLRKTLADIHHDDRRRALA